MAPGPDGSLFVSIPKPGGAVLALLDRDGQSRPGWPIAVKDSTSCGPPLPVDDGSVRIVCDGKDLPTFDNDSSDVRAFAFDVDGRLMPGWPVEVRPGSATVVGRNLVVAEEQIVTDVVATGRVSWMAWVTTIAADGTTSRGVKVPMVEVCCGGTRDISGDGVLYRVESVGEWSEGSPSVNRIVALDRDGPRPGWPVRIDGIPSGPAFGPGGQVVVTAASADLETSQVVAFDRAGDAAAATSAHLRFVTAETGVDCIVGNPEPPVIAQDGTVFVFGALDPSVFALDPSLQVMPGWPFEPSTPLERPDPYRGEDGLNCTSLAVPAASPDGTLYLPLQARDGKVGGNLVAVGPDGRVRTGWPLELKRPGAGFWSVVVGSDGTVYALAIEPESGDEASASILAIAPDSTVRYTTTIIDP